MNMESAGAHKRTGTKEESIHENTHEQVTHPSEEMFDVYVRANLEHPQTGVGIISLVGAAAFSSRSNFEQFSNSVLSHEQAQRLAKFMRAAHAARNIEAKNLSQESQHESAVQNLWATFKARILATGARYISTAAQGEEGRVTFEVDPEETINVNSLCAMAATSVRENVRLRPDLFQEAHRFFELSSRALEQDEVKELEQERRSLLNNRPDSATSSAETADEEGRKLLARMRRSSELIDLLNQKVDKFISEHASEAQLSVDLSEPSKVADIFGFYYMKAD